MLLPLSNVCAVRCIHTDWQAFFVFFRIRKKDRISSDKPQMTVLS